MKGSVRSLSARIFMRLPLATVVHLELLQHGAFQIDAADLKNESGPPSELGSRHGRCPAFPGLLELHLGPKRRGSDSDKGRLRRASRDYTGGEGECQKSQRNWAGCPMAPRSASFHLLGRQDHPGRPPTRTSGYAAGALRSETE